MLLHKNPCPRGHEIYNFGRPFLGQPIAIGHLSAFTQHYFMCDCHVSVVLKYTLIFL